MTEELVSHKLAVLAKEIGFNEECFYSYATDDKGDIELHSSFDLTGEFAFTEEDIQAAEENGYTAWFAPTHSQLQRWLREEHEIELNVSSVHYCSTGSPRKDGVMICYAYFIQVTKEMRNTPSNSGWFTYEEAFNAGLIEACKLLSKHDRS